MNTPLETAALQAAYAGDWQQVIKSNLQIVKEDPQNLAALNRLAKAHLELGHPHKAVTFYKQVLKIDRYNTIAQKNLQRLEHYSANGKTHVPKQIYSSSFIEEPGITKSVHLVNTCEQSILAQVNGGDKVNLTSKKRFIAVTSIDGLYLGKIPEDLSLRLNVLIQGGNQYQAWVQSIDKHHIKIFIKESLRSNAFKNIPSFTDSDHSSYLAFPSPETVYLDRPDTSRTEEQE